MEKLNARQIQKLVKQYRFHPSSVGNIMTKGRGRGITLSATAKRYLDEVLMDVLWRRRKTIISPFLDKGIEVEEQSITLLSEVLDTLLVKNKEKFENKYVRGIPDVVLPGVVIDIKSAWDLMSFAHVDDISKIYYWQLQSYMWLTGADIAMLAYVLVDTPMSIIQGEIRRQMYRKGIMGGTTEYDKLHLKVEHQLKFGDIPDEHRVKIYFLARDNEAIDNLKERIELARGYLIEKATKDLARVKEDITSAKAIVKQAMKRKAKIIKKKNARNKI